MRDRRRDGPGSGRDPRSEGRRGDSRNVGRAATGRTGGSRTDTGWDDGAPVGGRDYRPNEDDRHDGRPDGRYGGWVDSRTGADRGEVGWSDHRPSDYRRVEEEPSDGGWSDGDRERRRPQGGGRAGSGRLDGGWGDDGWADDGRADGDRADDAWADDGWVNGWVDDGWVDDRRNGGGREPGDEYDRRDQGRNRRSAPDPGHERPRAPRGRMARLLARWVPAPVAARLDPGRTGAVALVLVALVAAVIAAVGVWSSRPQAQPVASLPAVAAGPDVPGAPAPAAAPGGPIVVSVVGKVARPGLVRVPDGSRVADALDAVGGALPGVNLSTINLARRVGDGEQVAIGVPPAPDAAPGEAPASGREPGSAVDQPLPSGSTGSSGSSGGAAVPGGKVNLNQATADQLDALPGVGPATAAKILDWRNRNGRFARVEQLREVDGIGERRYAQLSGLVTV